MKKLSLIICSLFVIANAIANNEITSSGEVSSVIEKDANTFSFEDHMLSFGKESKLVITDTKGHVIFYNENVQAIDFSSWEHGSYIAQVNDKETFEFTL